MEEPIVALHNPSVSLDFETGDIEIRGHLTWDGGPHPEVVWVWAYFLNPEEARSGFGGSRSHLPIKLLHPIRHANSADIVARGHFHWWNNPDVPRRGYVAKIVVAAASSAAAQVPVGSRDYSMVDAVQVEIREKSPSVVKNDEYDVALSYAGEDRSYVEKVATLLKQSGIKVFYDKFEEVDLWGRDLTDHLADVYGKRSRWVVLFISAHYAAKAWPNHERKHALARALEEKSDRILPVRFDDTVLPGLATTVGYIDLRITSAEKLASMIIQKVRP